MGSRSRGEGTKHRQNIALTICVNQTISEINKTQRVKVTLRSRRKEHTHKTVMFLDQIIKKNKHRTEH
jgi:hypothetical protein